MKSSYTICSNHNPTNMVGNKNVRIKLTELKEMRDMIKNADGNITDVTIKTQLNDMKLYIEETKNAMTEIEKRLQIMDQLNEALTQKYNNNKTSINTLQSETNTLKQTNVNLSQKIESVENKITDIHGTLDGQINNLKIATEGQMKSLDDYVKETIVGEIDVCKQILNNHIEELNNHTKKLTNHEASITGIGANYGELRTRIQNLEESSNLSEIENRIEVIENYNTTQDEKIKVIENLTNDSNYNLMQTDIYYCKEQISSCENQINELSQKVSTLDSGFDGLGSILSGYESRISALESKSS